MPFLDKTNCNVDYTESHRTKRGKERPMKRASNGETNYILDTHGHHMAREKDETISLNAFYIVHNEG